MPTDISHKLDEFIATYLPTAKHMELSVEEYNHKTLQLRAPLGPSINDKQTAFGGSIYVVAVMSCWGMVYLRCVEAGMDPDIVVVKAEIEYLLPIEADIVARTKTCDEVSWQFFFRNFEERGRGKIELQSEVIVKGKVAARFRGVYAIIGLKKPLNLNP